MAKVPRSFWVKFASVFFFFYPQEWLQMFFLFGSTIAEGIGRIYFVAREYDLEVVLYTQRMIIWTLKDENNIDTVSELPEQNPNE